VVLMGISESGVEFSSLVDRVILLFTVYMIKNSPSPMMIHIVIDPMTIIDKLVCSDNFGSLSIIGFNVSSVGRM
jgi:hypothetical protein